MARERRAGAATAAAGENVTAAEATRADDRSHVREEVVHERAVGWPMRLERRPPDGNEGNDERIDSDVHEHAAQGENVALSVAEPAQDVGAHLSPPEDADRLL